VAALLAVLSVASLLPAAASAAPEAIAVVTLDPYADLKSQLTWVGQQVGNPTLAGFAESFILLATQGKGLAGLDVKRPVGIVVTSEGGPLPTAHAFVPVKDLAKLLGALQGMTGPVEEVDGVRRISPPGAPPVEIAEKDGWAILSQPGSPADLDEALKLIEPLSKDYSLAIEFFPSRMPAQMRDQLKAVLEQASRNAAAQGQPMDDAPLRAGLDNLENVERLLFGLAVDTENENVHLDVTPVLEADSEIAKVWSYAGKADGTVAAPATSDGKAAALRGHYVTKVPAGTEAAMRASFDQALESADDDPTMAVVAGVLRDALAAMLDTGAIDAGFTVDTSAADGDAPVPAVTIGMKVKDGAALETRLKERLGKADALPPGVKVAFDTGRHAGATLHELTLDTAGIPGGERLGRSVTVTLATGPQYVHLLVGGDVKKRLDEAAAAAGKPVAEARPIVGVEASLAAVIGYASRMMKAFQPDDPQGEALGEVAKQAAEKDSTQVQFSVKPIDRGATMRLLIDAGALQTVAASTEARVEPRAVPAMPLRPAQPRQLEKDNAPAIAP
jgi:hypothetical protein